MVDRPLERFAVGTATVAGTTVVVFLLGQFRLSLRTALLSVGTVPASMLFGYLWLLALVASEAALADGGLVDAVWSCLTGAVVALVVLTTLFVLGFVAPTGPVDPASVALLDALLVAVVAGATAGGLVWVVAAGCQLLGEFVAGTGHGD